MENLSKITSNQQVDNMVLKSSVVAPIIYRNRPIIACLCGRFFGLWNRFNFIIKDRDQTMHFKSQSIDVQVHDMIATINISQVFLNELQEAVEATYEFPTDPDVVVSRLVIEMDDRVIEGKIIEKEKAQEKYDDAIAGGNAAVLVKEKDQNKDLLQMTIGGINSQQEVKVNIQMIKHLQIEAGAYCLRIPTSYFIKSYNDIKLVQDFTANKAKFSTKYSFTINVETSNPIKYLSIPSHSDIVKKSENSSMSYTISQLDGSPKLLKKDIVVYFRTSKMDHPTLIAQVHPERKDEIACLMSIVPTFIPPQSQEETEIVVDKRPDEVDISFPKSDENRMVFIFIVDRSGSMIGNKMEMTLKALRLFIKSLPPNARFEIISFGTKYYGISKDRQGFINNDDNFNKINVAIAKMSADLGGTNIHDPLEYAITKLFVKVTPNQIEEQKIRDIHTLMKSPIEPIDQELIRKIFLLTDGAVNDPAAVLNLASQNQQNTQIHTFGIGNDCSKYLVKQLARAGRGSYSFVEEGDNLNAKI
ncbi:UNKNOWN [Stylonychia lemnae]|uniref:Uncharacterized protein n=1 Tax=Stylonychia lemnae TaxID=5949 RepID=A0A078APD0_STYLE|nr:UNKNOWN [Stylonychia lemnae]|eukprot:CDW82813.1 UNKNOWN [Stylonychia lemnae]